MSQIFRRIRNIAKSYLNDREYATVSDLKDQDEELKKIIEELNSDKKKYESREKEGRNENKTDGKMSINKAFAVLGIDDNSTNEQIKDAYKRKVREYHPDKVAALGSDLQELAARKTIEINEAYRFLKNFRGF